MEDIEGMPLKARKDITNGICGSDGLVANTDIDTYNTRLNQVRSLIAQNDSLKNKKKIVPTSKIN